MFERRLKFLLILFILPVLAVTLKLVQLQVLRADDYRVQAKSMLEGRTKFLPYLRGEIADRNGKSLAKDAPAWDICVQYKVIERDVPGDAPADTPNAIDPCWQAIVDLTGVPVEQLFARAGRIKRQVTRMRERHWALKGWEEPIAEETIAHPVVSGLSQQQQVEASLRLGAYPNIEINPSHVRAYLGGEAVGHLLGQLVEVDLDAINTDPMADDDLARYRPGDVHGVSGAEAIGESVLRGWRGCIQENRDRQPTSSVEPINGHTFRLSIDYTLQEAFYNRLAQAVDATEFKTGGCAVLIHVPTRQILAMVDYPSVDPAATPQQRADLLKDTARQPWLFRAIREYYPPGSTVKPMFLTAALSEGVISPQTQFNCYGRLFVDYPDIWRCTGTHAQIGPIAAIQRSCNVYFYHVGEKLGVTRELEWMDRFGLGRPTGIGLPGELPGRLAKASNSKGEARYLAIGQGTFDVTPLQVANMVASEAAGEYRPVTLKLEDSEPRPAVKLPVSDGVWRIVREGMYKVANEHGGTAFGEGRATINDSQFVVLGKTGSAEVPGGRTIETLYVCHLPDGRVQEIVAPDRAAALAQADCPPADRDKIIVAGFRSYRRYPPESPEGYTHAWFVGYLAPRGNYLSSVRSGEAGVAIAVVIEYTGHGGEVAAPVAGDMLRMFLRRSRGQETLLPAEGGEQ